MYRLNVKKIAKLEKKYKDSPILTNVLYTLINSITDENKSINLQDNLNLYKSINIATSIDLKIIKEEKTGKKKNTSKK